MTHTRFRWRLRNKTHRQYLWVAACLISVWGLLGCGPSQERRTEADNNYRIAQQYLGGQSYLLAEQEIRKSIDILPEAPRYYELLALIYQAQGRLKHADEAYRAALQHQEAAPSVLVNYSSLLLLQGRYDEAISTAQRALQNESYDGQALAHTNIGLAYLKKPRSLAQPSIFVRLWIISPLSPRLTSTSVWSMRDPGRTVKRFCPFGRRSKTGHLIPRLM